MLGLLVLLLLAGGSRRPAGGDSLDTLAAEARQRAREAAERARQTPTPQARQEAAQTQNTAAQLTNASQVVKAKPPPWPQVVPAGLPPFPGGGWVPDAPPGPGVVARAFQLLPELWKFGPGTRKTEQTNRRWITYVAQQMGEKKGVVAFRLANEGFAPPPPPPPPPQERPPVVVRTPIVVSPGAPLPTVRASETRPAEPLPINPSSIPPTIRQGSSGPIVQTLQQKLSIVPADGKFGPQTRGAVVAFQTMKGLSPDGVVGPMTWAALGFGQAA